MEVNNHYHVSLIIIIISENGGVHSDYYQTPSRLVKRNWHSVYQLFQCEKQQIKMEIFMKSLKINFTIVHM